MPPRVRLAPMKYLVFCHLGFFSVRDFVNDSYAFSNSTRDLSSDLVSDCFSDWVSDCFSDCVFVFIFVVADYCSSV